MKLCNGYEVLAMSTRPGKRKAEKQAAPPEEDDESAEEEESLSLDASETTPSVQCALLSEATPASRSSAD